MNTPLPSSDALQRLREAGAAQWDAVGWHHIETLAQRTLGHSGPARVLLQNRLDSLLKDFDNRMSQQPRQPSPSGPARAASPLAALLQEMPPPAAPGKVQNPLQSHQESPRVRQFRQQLRRLSVQKQVSQAMALRPQNAGPINSHMLVLRALGLMQGISPDYLNRFMTHIDTLLCLEDAERMRAVKKNSPTKSRKK